MQNLKLSLAQQNLRMRFTARRMNTALTLFLIFVLAFTVLNSVGEACTPPKDWQYLSNAERAQKAEIVVYGTVVQSPRMGPKSDERGHRYLLRHYKAQFKLHCVFKGPKLPQYINVTGFGFVPGLCTNSKAYLNRTYVVFLKNKYSSRGKFRVAAINIQVGTVEIKSKVKLKEIIRAVGGNSLHPIGDHKRMDKSCLRQRQCTEVHSRRTRKRNNKKRKCCRKHCAPRTTRAQEITQPPTKFDYKLKFTNFRSADVTGEVIPAFRVGESTNSRSAGFLPMHWFYMLVIHSLMFVLLRCQQP